MIPKASLVILAVIYMILPLPAQKIDEPRPACSSLNKCNCEFICKTYATNADENFGLSGRDLVELRCQDGITSTGYDPLGMDLSMCLNCVRFSKPGAKTSNQLVYWSNICDLAWHTSTSAAVDVLGKTYVEIPDGQVSCTNNTLSAVTISTRPLATTNDSPQTNRQAIDTSARTQEDGVATAGNIQTLSQNRVLPHTKQTRLFLLSPRQ